MEDIIDNIDRDIKKAINYHQIGNLRLAEDIYKKILTVQPFHSDALHLLGCIARQEGRPAEAVTTIKKALTLSPDNIVFHRNLGISYHDLGDARNAILCFEKVIKSHPNSGEAWYFIGLNLQHLELFEKAVVCFKKALVFNSDISDAIYRLGVVCYHLGQYENSIPYYQKFIDRSPDAVVAHNAIGAAYQKIGMYQEAINAYLRAVEIQPDFADAYLNLGIVFQEQRKFDEAIQFFCKAIRFDPENCNALNSLGNICSFLGDYKQAVSFYSKVLRIDPCYVEAINNMGLAYKYLGNIRESLFFLKMAVELNPDYKIKENYLEQLQNACNWIEADRVKSDIENQTTEAIRQGMIPDETPFSNITRTPDIVRNSAVARAWSRSFETKTGMDCREENFLFDDRRKVRSKKLTIGYLSSDFYDHAVAHIVSDLFGYHDRNKFNVFCYSRGNDDGSYYRDKIRKDCNKFVDLNSISDMEAAEIIYNDKVDILVEMNGYTKNGSLRICAYRPAPVQVCYLGFLGTTGVDFIDYIIADHIVVPDEHIKHYFEKIVFMPHCYQVTNYSHYKSDKRFTRADYGLPEQGIVFCSFNELYKVDARVFNVWMNILRRTKESVLWLIYNSELTCFNLREQAKSFDVDPSRLVFSKKIPLAEHLKRLTLADIALDTLIYNGGATTSNALWSGLPVITVKGGNYVSRMSSSNLEAMGLPELVATSVEEYEELAVALAETPEKYNHICSKIAKARQTSPLFNTGLYVKGLEQAYLEMWDNINYDKQLHHIQVS